MAGLLILSAHNGVAFANCKISYDATLTLLNSHLQQAKQKQLQDADAFEMAFKQSVDVLQTEHCLPELLNLIQHIQTEQQKHPVQPAQQKGAPILD